MSNGIDINVSQDQARGYGWQKRIFQYVEDKAKQAGATDKEFELIFSEKYEDNEKWTTKLQMNRKEILKLMFLLAKKLLQI
jgi:hypothetical protein